MTAAKVEAAAKVKAEVGCSKDCSGTRGDEGGGRVGGKDSSGESNVALAFKRGWASLELYLRLQHQASIDADAAPSSMYETITKLGDAFKPPLIATLHTSAAA